MLEFLMVKIKKFLHFQIWRTAGVGYLCRTDVGIGVGVGDAKRFRGQSASRTVAEYAFGAYLGR